MINEDNQTHTVYLQDRISCHFARHDGKSRAAVLGVAETLGGRTRQGMAGHPEADWVRKKGMFLVVAGLDHPVRSHPEVCGARLGGFYGNLKALLCLRSRGECAGRGYQAPEFAFGAASK